MSHSKTSLLTLTLFAMMFDTERESVPASIAEFFQERDPARATASGSSGHLLPNAQTCFRSFWTPNMTKTSPQLNVIYMRKKLLRSPN